MSQPIIDPTSPEQFLEETRIGKYLVKAYVSFGDVLLKARGFTMVFPEKPSAQPSAHIREGQPAAKLFNDPVFVGMLTEFGGRWRKLVWAQMRKDWGEKCFVPDAKGFYHHPLFACAGKRFFCVHCEKKFPGSEVAANFWNCPDPECDGSPIDMH